MNNNNNDENGKVGYQSFMTQHKNQLETSGVPPRLWESLYKKIVHGDQKKLLLQQQHHQRRIGYKVHRSTAASPLRHTPNKKKTKKSVMQSVKDAASSKLRYVRNIPTRASEKFESALLWIKFLISGIAITLSSFIFLSGVATLSYALFYYTFVPSSLYESSLALTFDSCSTTPQKCSFIGSSHVFSASRTQILMAGQPYTISVTLDVPHSNANKELGMFMSCLKIFSKSETLIDQKCKSSLMTFVSPELRKIKTLLFIPAYLFGYMDEKEKVRIEYFNTFVDDPLNPSVRVELEIQSRFVEIYSAQFRIHANFEGIRWYMFYYPITSAVVGISLNLMALTLVVLLSWLRFFAPTHSFTDEMNDKPDMSSASSVISDNDMEVFSSADSNNSGIEILETKFENTVVEDKKEL